MVTDTGTKHPDNVIMRLEQAQINKLQYTYIIITVVLRINKEPLPLQQSLPFDLVK